MLFTDVLQNRSSLKCPNIHRKTYMLDTLFNKCDRKIRHMKNQIITHASYPGRKSKAIRLVK